MSKSQDAGSSLYCPLFPALGESIPFSAREFCGEKLGGWARGLVRIWSQNGVFQLRAAGHAEPQGPRKHLFQDSLRFTSGSPLVHLCPLLSGSFRLELVTRGCKFYPLSG